MLGRHYPGWLSVSLSETLLQVSSVSIPGGTPVETVDEVTVPRPAAVSAATWMVYGVVEVRPLSWYCRVELDSRRSSRVVSTLDTSHHSS